MRNPRTTDPFNESSELYRDLDKENVILREYLAAARTDLATERTFLTYVRTVLALFAGGVTVVYYFDSASPALLGWTLALIAGYDNGDDPVQDRRISSQTYPRSPSGNGVIVPNGFDQDLGYHRWQRRMQPPVMSVAN